jgi:HEPN domain-containing protein
MSQVYLYDKARYPQAVYMLCQAIEKVLKGARIELLNAVPPKSHRLERLAVESGITFSNDQLQVLSELSKQYAVIRYPDFAQTRFDSKAKVRPIVEKAKELYLWTQRSLHNH